MTKLAAWFAMKIASRTPLELIWITLMLSSCLTSICFSLGLLLYQDAFSLAKSYEIFAQITTEKNLALIGICISLNLILFLRSRFLIIMAPINLFYWLFLSRSIFHSAGGFTPVAGMFVAMAIHVSIAYILAGGLRISSLKNAKTVGDNDDAAKSKEES